MYVAISVDKNDFEQAPFVGGGNKPEGGWIASVILTIIQQVLATLVGKALLHFPPFHFMFVFELPQNSIRYTEIVHDGKG